MSEAKLSSAQKAEALTEQIDDAIESLAFDLSQGHTQTYLDRLDWYARMHKYSFGNSILIHIQNPTATLVAGYKRWQELGFNVKKGETGIAIRAPWLRKFVDEETGEIEQRLVGYLVTYVFDISQTVEYPGKKPPTIYREVPGNWDDLYGQLRASIQLKGVMVSEDPMPGGVHGMYSNSHIRINQDLDSFYRSTCIIHEYVHHLAHATQEQREGTTRDHREWIAESVCYAVCKAIGIDHATARDYLLMYRLTVEDLHPLVREIQQLTKTALSDLNLLLEIPRSIRERQAESRAAD